MKKHSEDSNLERRLRDGRAEPSAELTGSILKRMATLPTRRPRATYRFAFAGGLTAALLVVLASVGGMSYAANQLTHAVSAVKKTLVVSSKPSTAKAPNAAQAPSSAKNQYNGGPPVVTRLSPDKGCVGANVKIAGQDLVYVSSVSFNGVGATFTVKSNNLVNAIAPTSTSGPVTVSGPNGTGVGPSFTYIGPTVGGFKPNKGPVGTSVEIKGKCFASVTSVTFHGTPAVSYTVNSFTSITATVPAGATTGDVGVSTAYGSDSKGTFKVG
jgi:hypothetical protein